MAFVCQTRDGRLNIGTEDVREWKAIQSLEWYVRDRVIAVIHDLRLAGYWPYCIEGRRSPARQLLLFAQGRSKLRHGRHCVGKAADIVDGRVKWQAKPEFWQALGRAAKKHGLKWGGDWKRFYDPAHVEWR